MLSNLQSYKTLQIGSWTSLKHINLKMLDIKYFGDYLNNFIASWIK